MNVFSGFLCGKTSVQYLSLGVSAFCSLVVGQLANQLAHWGSELF